MSRWQTVKSHPITKALALMLVTVFLVFWVQELWWLHTQYRLNQDREAAIRFQKILNDQKAAAGPPAPVVKPPAASTLPAPDPGKGG